MTGSQDLTERREQLQRELKQFEQWIDELIEARQEIREMAIAGRDRDDTLDMLIDTNRALKTAIETKDLIAAAIGDTEQRITDRRRTDEA